MAVPTDSTALKPPRERSLQISCSLARIARFTTATHVWMCELGLDVYTNIDK